MELKNNTYYNADQSLDIFQNIGTGEVDENNFPLSESDFLFSCEGMSDDGDSNSLLEAILMSFTGDSEQDMMDENCFQLISSRKTKNANITIYDMGDFVQFNFAFKTHLAPELRFFWNLFENYASKLKEKQINDLPENPFLIINIEPNKYLGECFLSLLNPFFWSLQPQEAGGNCNSIRFCVLKENVLINPISTDLDINTLKAEASRSTQTILKEK